MIKKLLLLTIAVSLGCQLSARVKMPSIFGDNMVLQQKDSVAFWGYARPNTKVSIKPGWTRKSHAAHSDSTGHWFTKIPTPSAGGPFSVVISDGEKLTFNNVLIGEVWLCSGQSNMEMPVYGFGGQPADHALETVFSADPNDPIRIFSIKKDWSLQRKTDCDAFWRLNGSEVVANTSAVAYYFAKNIQRALDVPVGIIVSAVGGTRIEAWINENAMAGQWPEYYQEVNDEKISSKSKQRLGVLFNAMISPVCPYTVKGLLWYQGESNAGNSSKYARLQKIYIDMMRNCWNKPQMPFYFVQIAPFSYPKLKLNQAAALREAQMQSLSMIENCGMATTVDIGDPDCIHPRKKKEVGERLAAMALRQDYGFNLPGAFPPIFEQAEFNGNKVTVFFANNDFGLGPRGGEITGLQLAGEDRLFHKANGKVVRKSGQPDAIEVTCPQVVRPVAVRYAYDNNGIGNIVNGLGIPAAPFRTDNWE